MQYLKDTIIALIATLIAACAVEYKDKSRFGAFERCINYRKDKGEEWFFGALGETMTMLDNAVYLNAAHKITGLGFIIDVDYGCCSCSEHNFEESWNCYLGEDGIYCGLNDKGYTDALVPFYASTKEVNKQEK